VAQNRSSSGGMNNTATGGQSGDSMTDQAKETAGQVVDQARQTAGQVAGQARDQVTSRVASQKDRAAEGLGSMAQALRQTGQQLRGQDQLGITSYIDSAASQVERISGYLQRNDVGQLVDDVEGFARRQPGLFLGGAFVLGLLGARFLKSSRPNTAYGGYSNYSRGYTSGMSGMDQTYMAQRERQFYTGNYPSEQDIREASAVPNYGPGTKSRSYSPNEGTTTGGATTGTTTGNAATGSSTTGTTTGGARSRANEQRREE
jgi:hypothetical protein